MSVAAAINILFGANTAAVDKALANLEKKFGSLMHQVREFGGIFEGLAHLIEPAFEEIDALGRVSKQLDIPTEKLAGLELAAYQADMSFEQLTGSMQKMMAGIAKVTTGEGEAATTTGKGPVAAALEQLNISAAQLSVLKPEEKLALIADKLKNIGDAGERVNIAKSLFGKGGVGMLNMLEDGAEGLQKWQRAAEEAGIALNGMDVEKVEQANMSVKMMWTSFKGLVQTLTVALAPAIQGIANLVRWLSSIVLPFWKNWHGVIVTIIEIMIAYRAIVWTIVAAERAWAAAKAIQAAVQAGSWQKMLLILALAGAAVAGINKLFDELENKFKDLLNPKIPPLPPEEEMGGGLKPLGKHALPNAAAVQRGSAEAIHVLAQAGAKGDRLEGLSRQQVAHLKNIEKNTKNPARQRAANFGGR